MSDNSGIEKLKSRKFRDLQAVAKACKKAGLCGPYSGLDKASLVGHLSAIPPERLRPLLNPSPFRRFLGWWIAGGVSLMIAVVSLAGTFGGWFLPRSTVNDHLASANDHFASTQNASSQTILAQEKNEAASLNEMRSVRLELTQSIEQTDRLAAGLAEVIGFMPLQNRQMRDSIQKLSQLLATFRETHAGMNLSPQAEAELRQAQATLELARGKYKETLELISDDFLDQLANRAAAAGKEALAAGTVRAMALEGMGRWEEAVEVYARVSRFDTSGRVQLEIAYCLNSSGRPAAALQTVDAVLAQYETIAAPSKFSKDVAAYAYKARGVIYGEIGRSDESIRDIGKAVTMFAAAGDNSHGLLLASLLDLAIYTYDCDRAASDRAFARADELLAGQELDDDEITNEFSRLLNHRVRKLLDDGKLREAVALAQSVVNTRRDALARHNGVVSQEWLAESLSNLAAARARGGDPVSANHDLSEAIAILSDLVETKGQHRAIPIYIQVLTGRAETRCQIGRPRDGLADAETAVGLGRFYVSISGGEVGSSMVKYIACALRAYAQCLERVGQNSEALAELDQSIALFESPRLSGLPGITLESATALGQRGQLLMAMNRLPDATAQFRDMIERCSQNEMDRRSAEGRFLRLVARIKLADCLTGMGQKAEAAATYQAIIDEPRNAAADDGEIRQWTVRAKSSLVLLLCSSRKLRDSKRALQLSNEAMKELDTEWVAHHALAAAYADDGDFSAAVETEERALPQCPLGFKTFAQNCLAGYKNHRAWWEQCAKSD